MILPITFILLIFQFIINFVSRNKQSGVLLLFVLSLVIAFWRGFHKVNFRIQIVSELLSFIFLSNASSIFSRICLCSLIFGTKHKKLSLNKNVSAFPVRRSGSLKNYKKSIFFIIMKRVISTKQQIWQKFLNMLFFILLLFLIRHQKLKVVMNPARALGKSYTTSKSAHFRLSIF